jgi:hypothetical protein
MLVISTSARAEVVCCAGWCLDSVGAIAMLFDVARPYSFHKFAGPRIEEHNLADKLGRTECEPSSELTITDLLSALSFNLSFEGVANFLIDRIVERETKLDPQPHPGNLANAGHRPDLWRIPHAAARRATSWASRTGVSPLHEKTADQPKRSGGNSPAPRPVKKAAAGAST